MDIVLLITAAILIFIIIGVYILNSVEQTSDIKKLFQRIIYQNPTTTAFTLGRRDEDVGYQNVVIDQDGKLKIQIDKYPVKLDGGRFIMQDHGVVMPLPDNKHGFQISGVDFTTFECPPNYEGLECNLKPICGENDANTEKPLTGEYFNLLYNFNKAHFETTNVIAETLADPKVPHPRIKIQCTDNQNYKLKTCPPNKILNADLKCIPYDICEDHVNGFKHKFQISNDERHLYEHEYYVCENNKSVRVSCGENYTYDETIKTCIESSPCQYKGNQTLPFNDNSYIQCNNNHGKLIYCPNGVIFDEEHKIHRCSVKTCVPSDYIFNNELYKYKYGVVLCKNGVPKLKLCSEKTKTKVFDYNWFRPLKVELTNWPEEMMDENNNCVEPTSDIMLNPILNVHWNNFLDEAYPFNIQTGKFVCPENTKYTIDYANQTITPPLKENEILNILKPCSDMLFDTSDAIYDIKQRNPFDLISFIYIYYATDKHHWWPVRLTNGKYCVTNVHYSLSGYEFIYITSNKPPLSFILPSTGAAAADASTPQRVPIKLQYFRNPDYVVNDTEYSYFYGSGKIERPYFINPDVSRSFIKFVDYVNIMEDPNINEIAVDTLKMGETDRRVFNSVPSLILMQKEIIINAEIEEDAIHLPTGILIFRVVDRSETHYALQLANYPKMVFSMVDYPILDFDFNKST